MVAMTDAVMLIPSTCWQACSLAWHAWCCVANMHGVVLLQELGENDLAGVRNLPAYIMGICKRYRREGGPRFRR